MPSSIINEATRRDWRELGFYYDRDDVDRVWRLQGTRQGLFGFATLLREYSANPQNLQVSEHKHFGPYGYLEVGTWPEPEITDHWIAGPLSALAALADAIERHLTVASPGARLSLGGEFAPGSPYQLQLEVRNEDFDPALEDPDCNR